MLKNEIREYYALKYIKKIIMDKLIKDFANLSQEERQMRLDAARAKRDALKEASKQAKEASKEARKNNAAANKAVKEYKALIKEYTSVVHADYQSIRQVLKSLTNCKIPTFLIPFFKNYGFFDQYGTQVVPSRDDFNRLYKDVCAWLPQARDKRGVLLGYVDYKFSMTENTPLFANSDRLSRCTALEFDEVNHLYYLADKRVPDMQTIKGVDGKEYEVQRTDNLGKKLYKTIKQEKYAYLNSTLNFPAILKAVLAAAGCEQMIESLEAVYTAATDKLNSSKATALAAKDAAKVAKNEYSKAQANALAMQEIEKHEAAVKKAAEKAAAKNGGSISKASKGARAAKVATKTDEIQTNVAI